MSHLLLLLAGNLHWLQEPYPHGTTGRPERPLCNKVSHTASDRLMTKYSGLE